MALYTNIKISNLLEHRYTLTIIVLHVQIHIYIIELNKRLNYNLVFNIFLKEVNQWKRNPT